MSVQTGFESDLPLPKQGMLTVLSALGRFPRQEVFEVLADYFFHSDREVGEAALRSSAFPGNQAAVPHLLHIVERDEDPRRKTLALEVLAAIGAPQAVDSLSAYFGTFTDPLLKTAVLKALSAVDPRHQRVLELNRGILTQGNARRELAAAAVRGLVAAGDFPFLEHYLVHAQRDMQLEAFRGMLGAQSEAVASFLRKLEPGLDLDPQARGVCLAAYLLNASNPNPQFLLDALGASGGGTLSAFLDALHAGADRSCSHKGVLKLLLMLPSADREIETTIGWLIDRLLYVRTQLSPGSTGELAAVASAHLDSVFKKVQATFLSLKGMRSREDLLPLLLAHVLQKYCAPPLLSDTLVFFQDRRGDPKSLLCRLSDCLSECGSSDVKGYRACTPLFKDPDKRLQAAMMLRRVDPQMPVLLARLCRLVRVAGVLRLKGQQQKIWDIYLFAAEEKVSFLERASVVTLCRLGSRKILQQARAVFDQPTRRRELLPSFIRGARYLPAELIAGSVVRLLFHPELTPTERDLALETLMSMDLSSSRELPGRVLDALEEGYFEPEQKERIAGVVAVHGDRSLVGRLTDLLYSADPLLRSLAVRVIREIERGSPGADRAVLVERLYGMLEDQDAPVRVEALAALLALEDEYAGEIAADWIESGDRDLAVPLLERLPEVMSRGRVSLALRAVRSADPSVQGAVRGLLASLAGGVHADAVREEMMNELDRLPDLTGWLKRRSPESVGRYPHAKLEYQLRRDHSQELAVVFIDMVGYSERTSRSDMTGLMHLVRSFEDMVMPSLRIFNGKIVKKLGDGVLAVFKHPATAVIAALEIQGRIQEHNTYAVDQDKFAVRVGAHHGQVMWRDGDVFGDVVNMAARMQETAAPGEVLITGELHDRVCEYVTCEGRGAVRVKGREEPICAYRPRGLARDVRAILEFRDSSADSLLSVQAMAGAMEDCRGTSPEDSPADSLQGSLENLKEAFFVPRFDLPGDKARCNGMEEVLQSMFTELSAAASEISRDTHEEYLFKRFLQQKWNEALERLGKRT